MLRLWNTLVGMNNKRLLYNHMLTQNPPWVAKIKNIFNEINCAASYAMALLRLGQNIYEYNYIESHSNK